MSYGLKEGGISLTGLESGVDSSKCVIADHKDVLKKVEALRDQIVSGELKVDDPAAELTRTSRSSSGESPSGSPARSPTTPST